MLSPYGLKTACRHAIAADKVTKRSIIAAGRGLRKGLTAHIAEQIACKQIRLTHPSAAINLNVLIYPTATRQNLTGRDKREREIVVGHPAVQYMTISTPPKGPASGTIAFFSCGRSVH